MLSIIIPAYNEEKRLGESLEKLIDFLKTYPAKVEVILVDDGSTDKTFQLAQSYQEKIPNFKIIKLEKNTGKGFAVKKGYEKAKGNIVLFTDSDFSTPITEVPKMVKKIKEGFDIAIGSRATKGSEVKKHQSWLREKLGRIANLLIKISAVPKINDTQCGFKAFKKTSTDKIFERQKIHRYAFDIELLYLAKREGLKIAEVPIQWYNSPQSKVNPILDGLQILSDLVKIRLLHAEKNGSLIDRFLYFVQSKKTFAKFALVGTTGVAVDYSLYFLLTRILQLTPLQANPINVEAAIIWTFIFNNLWTFSGRNRERHIVKKFLAFQTTALGGLMISQIQILLYTNYLDIYDLFAKLLSIPVMAVFNYTVNNRWTFHHTKLSKKISACYFLFVVSLFIVYLILVKEITGSFSLFIQR